MADSYHIIDGQVVPFHGGRKDTNTDAWRDATPLELQLQEQLAEYEHAIAAKDAEVEALRAEVDEWKDVARCASEQQDSLFREARALSARADKLRAEVERLTFEMERLQQQYDERTACMIVHRGSALACSDAVRAAYSDEHRRAERLAEALRHLRNHTSVNSHQIELIDTALNPTAAQEGKESFWPKLPGSGGPDWTGHD